jgi:hypothetical protein
MSFMDRILIFIFCFFFVSCVAISTFEIQVLEPATDPVTPDIENVVIINRTIIDDQGSGESDDSISGQTGIQIINRSTTELVYALADILNESPGIGFIDTANILESPGLPGTAIPFEFDSGFVGNLCDSMNANAVISIDIFNVEIPDTIMLTSESDGSHPAQYFVGRIDVPVSALWRVYRMPEGILTDEYAWFDTMSWEHAAFNTIEIADNLPSRETIRMEAAYFSALSFARKIAPYWVTEKRNFFFRGNIALRNAAYHLTLGEFDDARQKYEELLDHRNKNIAAVAAFNLALVYEITGEYRLAHNWAVRSYQYRDHPVTARYIETLEERLGKINDLDRQLGRIP